MNLNQQALLLLQVLYLLVFFFSVMGRDRFYYHHKIISRKQTMGRWGSCLLPVLLVLIFWSHVKLKDDSNIRWGREKQPRGKRSHVSWSSRKKCQPLSHPIPFPMLIDSPVFPTEIWKTARETHSMLSTKKLSLRCWLWDQPILLFNLRLLSISLLQRQRDVNRGNN